MKGHKRKCKKVSAPKKSQKAPLRKKKLDLSVVAEPAEFFKQQVSRALENQKIKIDPHTEFYLVDLLTRFMLTENLFTTSANGTRQEEVLALLLNKTLATSDSASKQKGLRRLGDVSLYTAGFFADSLARKVVDVGYYIGMGRTAYGNLAQIQLDSYFRQVFLDLANRFHHFVDVLMEVNQLTGLGDKKNIIRLYETWLKTRSPVAERSLKEIGIIPNPILKRDWQ